MREFGFIGGLAVILVAFSLLGDTLQIIQLPGSHALAIQMEKNSEGQMTPEQKEKYQQQRKESIEKSKRGENNLAIGFVIYLVGFLLAFFRTLWGPRIILLGALFKLFTANDWLFRGYHILVLLGAIYLVFNWKKEIAV